MAHWYGTVLGDVRATEERGEEREKEGETRQETGERRETRGRIKREERGWFP
ncbi:hypothetical protein WN51_08032 [Melipona quadrifasciata]|uniref:Uncharacterized protein n=1 Tax=Melipona quadrifasciata TaxID=166423 RepID=A0A0N0U313_9HYME|nr:hypothetical protein WN51_08032 [Melipona quadrifasciata]